MLLWLLYFPIVVKDGLCLNVISDCAIYILFSCTEQMNIFLVILEVSVSVLS